MDRTVIVDVADLKVGPLGAGSAPILDGVSFQLHASEIFGIYGESGAGKTILSRALANWLPETLAYRGGSLSFAGTDILRMSGKSGFRVGRDIAYIGSKPQSSLDPTVPVGARSPRSCAAFARNGLCASAVSGSCSCFRRSAFPRLRSGTGTIPQSSPEG